MGGLLGSSALTTYVESAAAVREGGRTGITALVCSVCFFCSVFFYPWCADFTASVCIVSLVLLLKFTRRHHNSCRTGFLPTIATGPILLLIGVLIFISAVYEVDWRKLDNAIPVRTAP